MFCNKKLPRVDINTWKHLYRAYSKDKNNVYCMNFVEKDKLPQDWNVGKVKEYYKSQKF
ncbi:DKNYY domain-containing protein [Pasteurella atlantica]|nr:DKNYY domain-containing protein [Pasteurella atlantica]QVE21900.1 DKNYY domain-containing protein [Pasteurella atlantica]